MYDHRRGESGILLKEKKGRAMKWKIRGGQWINLMFLLCAVHGCESDRSPEFDPGKFLSSNTVKTMQLTSDGFEAGKTIDAKYTVEGADVSPPLSWSQVPDGTKSFALICDDPDAPSPENPADEPWVHWVIFNIPADRTGLPENAGRAAETPAVPGAKQGHNSWTSDNLGYRGPAPPPGSGPHRYFFKLYALDTKLERDAGISKAELLKAISGHVLGEGELIGVYER